MQTQLSCPLCNCQYSQQKLPRILSICGHTFCEICISGKIIQDGQNKCYIQCPQDKIICPMSNNNLKQFPINRSLLKIAQSNKVKTPHKDSSFQLSKTTKQEQFQQDLQIQEFKHTQNQLILEQYPTTIHYSECSQNRYRQYYPHDEENLCLLHQKPLQIVCVFDLKKICAKCAIFGEHKGHEFKSIQQIQEQKKIFCQQISTVFNQKKEIITRIEKKTTKPDIIAILSSNKQMLRKQVTDKFKKLIDAIKNAQSKVLDRVEKISKKIEKDIDQLYKIESNLIDNYDDWEKEALQKLNKIQKGNFEEQLQLLLKIESKKQKNTILQGQQLVQMIQSQQDNIINKSQALLGSANLKSNDAIFEFVETFVDVSDKIQSVYKEEQINKTIFQQKMNDNKFQNQKKHEEEDLLFVEQPQQNNSSRNKVVFQSSPFKTVQNIEVKLDQVKIVPFLQGKTFLQKSDKKDQRKILTKRQGRPQKMKTQCAQDNFSNYTSRQMSFTSEKNIRPSKKKLKSIKVPEKYQKILQSLFIDSLQILDLTNAQLGDTIIHQICQFIPGSKVKTVKFIRNKLTDEGIIKMLPFLGEVININLSQNLLTQKVLDIIVKNKQMLPKVKNIILSMNKIIERKHKNKIDELRKLQVTVSV